LLLCQYYSRLFVSIVFFFGCFLIRSCSSLAAFLSAGSFAFSVLSSICFLIFSASAAFLISFGDRVVEWGWSARSSGGYVGTGGGILGSIAGACLLALRVLVQFKFEFVGLMVGFIIGSTVVELAPVVCAATGLLVEAFPLFASCYAFLSSCSICFFISLASFLDGIRTRGASVFADLESPSGMVGGMGLGGRACASAGGAFFESSFFLSNFVPRLASFDSTGGSADPANISALEFCFDVAWSTEVAVSGSFRFS